MNDNNESFSKEMIISIGLYIFGSQITTVSEIILRFYDYLFKDGRTQSQYLLEFSFIGLAVGISATLILTSIKESDDPKRAQTILIGVTTALISGFLQITKAALSDTQVDQDMAVKAYFYFLIFIFLFIYPISVFVQSGHNWLDKCRIYIVFMSKILLWSLLIGSIVQMMIGFIILNTQIVPSTATINHAGKDLIFDPIMFVVLGSLWCGSHYAQGLGVDGESVEDWLRSSAYLLLIFLFGFGYFLVYGYESNEPLAYNSFLLTALFFAFLSSSPILSQILTRIFSICSVKVNSQNLHVKELTLSSLKISFSVFILVPGVVMFLGLSVAIVDNWLDRLLCGLLYGLAGAAIPLVMYKARVKESAC